MRRSRETRVLGGVCGGLSACTGIDVTIVRIGFVLLSIASGVMVLVYALAWLLVPMEGESENIFSRAIGDKRGIRLVAAVGIPVLIVMQVVISTLHIGFIGWPTVLAAAVLVLVWRNADEPEKTFIDSEVVPLFGADTHGHGRRWLVIRVIVGVMIAAFGIVLLV